MKTLDEFIEHWTPLKVSQEVHRTHCCECYRDGAYYDSYLDKFYCIDCAFEMAWSNQEIDIDIRCGECG